MESILHWVPSIAADEQMQRPTAKAMYKPVRQVGNRTPRLMHQPVLKLAPVQREQSCDGCEGYVGGAQVQPQTPTGALRRELRLENDQSLRS